MDDKFSDFLKNFDLLKLENSNLANMLKQLEQLKLTGLLERLDDLNKVTAVMKQMEDLKLSEIVKKIEEIKLSKILKDIEDHKFPELIKNIEKMGFLPSSEKAKDLDLANSVIKNVTIEHRQDSIPEQIKKLADLKEAGILTNEEFESKKKQLLERI